LGQQVGAGVGGGGISISADGGYNARQAEAAVATVPAQSVEIVKQSHDTKGFVVPPALWVAVMLRGGSTSMVTGKGIW
jgi:hypothetical protein